MRNLVQNRLPTVVLLILTSMVIFFPRTSWTQDYDATIFRGNKTTTEQFIEALRPSQGQSIKFRSLGIGGAKKTLADAAKKAASLELKFEFDSYQLTESAKGYLGQLGLALQNQELAKYNFLVEGHTDGQGADNYNLSLSRKRAVVVKQYLINNFSIDPSRLTAVGRGERELLDKKNPHNALNRRVQVVNLQ